MTHNEPMPWRSEEPRRYHSPDCALWSDIERGGDCDCDCDYNHDAYAEPEPPRQSLASCRVEAVMMSIALWFCAPVIMIALLADLLTDDRELWGEVRKTGGMISRMWRGEESWQ